MFLAVSFIMRILVSVGEASILPSAIAIGLKDIIEYRKKTTSPLCMPGSQVCRPEQEALTLSLIDTCYVVGLMLGPSLGGLLYDAAGLVLPFLVFGGGAAGLAGVSFRSVLLNHNIHIHQSYTLTLRYISLELRMYNISR